MAAEDTSLRGEDPGRWGHSLANLGELLLPILDRVGARSVAEVGAYAGDLTGMLLEWAERSGAKVVAIDPKPQPELVALGEHPQLTLIEQTSERALAELELPDALIIDGDHNYYTVRHELERIAEHAGDERLPLLLLHDVCWPHARRDAYYAPERIPPEQRQPITEGAGLFPGEDGVVLGGLPYQWAASREGGPENGVLTALEDFLAEREGLCSAVVPMFFGLGVVWDESASWAQAVAELVEPWEANPMVARLEANRVYLLASRQQVSTELGQLRQTQQRQAGLLAALADSRIFRLADGLSYLRHRRRGNSWQEQIRRALADED
jgi:hypothetical protein